MVTDALIQKKLVELGQKLSPPPSNFRELVSLLDELELYLSRIEQSPPEPIWKALEPAMKNITLKMYLKHPDKDVKLAVASCVSEITRITAPDAPFDDNIMKDIFQLIIGAFEKIHDWSSPLNQRRISILETCSKVRSSLILLDLECEDMIRDMFHHFLKNLRSNHSQMVFNCMENIMTLTIEESEDITPELLSDLLDTLKLDNKDVLPIAQGLARKVMANCADKIRTCLMRLVELNRIILSEYDEVVATICQGSSEALINMESNSSGEVMEDDNKLSERTVSDELPQVSSKEDQEVTCPEKFNTASNGDIHLESGDTTELPSSSAQKSERAHTNANSRSSKSNLESAAANQDGASNTNRSDVRKTNSSTEKVTPVTIDNNKEKEHHKETDIIQDDNDMPAMDVDSEKKHDNTNKSRPNSSKGKSQSKQRAKPKKPKGISGSKLSVSTTNGVLDSKATPLKGEDSKETEDADNALNGKDENNSTKKGKSKQKLSENDLYENGALDSKATPLKGGKSEETEDAGDVTNVLKGKDEGNSTKKGKSKQKPLPENDLSDNKQKNDNFNESRPISSKGKGQSRQNTKSKMPKVRNALKQAGKNIDDASDINSTALKSNEPQKTEDASDDDSTALKGDESMDNEDFMNVPEGKDGSKSSQGVQSKRKLSENGQSKNKQKPNPKKQKKDEPSGNNMAVEPTLKEFMSVHRSGSKTPVIDHTRKTKSRSKRTLAVDTEYKCDASVHKENQSLVGSKIDVWWPDDEAFYHGVIESYDPDTMKHKIVYDDGEIEILTLKDEKYKLDVSDSDKIVDNPTSQKAGGSSSKVGTASKVKGVPKSKSETLGTDLHDDNTTPSNSKKPKARTTTTKSNKPKAPNARTQPNNDADNATPEPNKKSKDETPKPTKSKAEASDNSKPKNAATKTGTKPKGGSNNAKANAGSANKNKAEGDETATGPEKKRSRKGGVK